LQLYTLLLILMAAICQPTRLSSSHGGSRMNFDSRSVGNGYGLILFVDTIMTLMAHPE
jgi:hypothetical protein